MSHHLWHRVSPALVGHEHEHVHSHGLVDPSIVRSRAGVKAVLIANYVTHEGESTWFEGVQLLTVYVILALAFGFA